VQFYDVCCQAEGYQGARHGRPWASAPSALGISWSPAISTLTLMNQSLLSEVFAAPIGTLGKSLLNWKANSAAEIVAYASSYRSAAMKLIGSHEGGQFVNIDEHALPVLFLYRHSLELYLKALVYRAAVVSIAEEELLLAVPRLWREHSLVRLLQMISPLLHSRHFHLWDEELEEKVGRVVRRLDGVDPGSYAFRYPVTSSGRPSLPDHFFTNIFAFSEVLENVLDDLSDICRCLEGRRLDASAQMKLALHTLRQE
jgi:hypothetical protein